jgi:small subunit ribosomal protein S1
MHTDPDQDQQEYARMLELYDTSFRNLAEGEVVKGTVLKVTPSEVIVDVGYKSEGIIQIAEFLDENGEVTVQAGDIVDVLLERTEDREGYVVLSREKAEKMKIWDEVEKAYAERKVVIAVSPSTSGFARSFRARRSTCVQCATSTRSAARSCACASSR